MSTQRDDVHLKIMSGERGKFRLDEYIITMITVLKWNNSEIFTTET